MFASCVTPPPGSDEVKEELPLIPKLIEDVEFQDRPSEPEVYREDRNIYIDSDELEKELNR